MLAERMDVLADVLSVTRLGATVIAQAELVPPWGIEVDPIADAHVHVVQRGTCWLRTSVERRCLRLDAGDVVLIRGGVGHSICDAPQTKPGPYKEVLAAMPERLARWPASRVQETTIVLCAKYLFQHVGPHHSKCRYPKPTSYSPEYVAAGARSTSLEMEHSLARSGKHAIAQRWSPRIGLVWWW